MDLNHPLFDTDAWRLVLSSLGCYCVTSLVVAAGVGGGGILVPMYAVILGVGAKHAVPVSSASNLGAALGNTFFLVRELHPSTDEPRRPLIDYSIAVLMQGGMFLGVTWGVLLNRLLPELIIVLVLVSVLGYTSLHTYLCFRLHACLHARYVALSTLRKAHARFRKETHEQGPADKKNMAAVLKEVSLTSYRRTQKRVTPFCAAGKCGSRVPSRFRRGPGLA